MITAATGKEGDAAKTEAKHKGAVGELIIFLEQSVHVSTLLDPEVNLTRHLYAIHKAPREHWQYLTELLVEKQWTVKQSEAIVEAISSVDIPEVLHGFLNPDV